MEVVLYDPDGELETRFPYLSFLTDSFRMLYTEEEQEKWDEPEKKVAVVAEENSPSAVPQADEYIWLWYTRRLDPNFYYCVENEGLFLEKAGKKMREEEKRSDERY